KNFTGKIKCELRNILALQGFNILELVKNLRLSTHESDSVHVCHDSLFDNFTGDQVLKLNGLLFTCLNINSDLLLNKFCNTSVDVLRAITWLKIDLLGTNRISSKRRIMLQTV